MAGALQTRKVRVYDAGDGIQSKGKRGLKLRKNICMVRFPQKIFRELTRKNSGIGGKIPIIHGV